VTVQSYAPRDGEITLHVDWESESTGLSCSAKGERTLSVARISKEAWANSWLQVSGQGYVMNLVLDGAKNVWPR
jgi:hypothetical protein